MVQLSTLTESEIEETLLTWSYKAYHSDLSQAYLEGFHFFMDNPPGKEHYKLLAYLSYKLFPKDTVILDIGSNRGASALALAFNKSNTVYTFDINEHPGIRDIERECSNVHFRQENILETDSKELIPKSDFIVLDTFHRGDFEEQMHQHLLSINWKGIMVCDDIRLNGPMAEWWEGIETRKEDITDIGHITGTGVIYYNV